MYLRIFSMYLVRQPPPEQILGLHRQFVFAPLCCYRLPELALLLGNVLTYLAAVLPPIPTAFWDRHPKKRPTASAASWLKLIFPMWLNWIAVFGKNLRLLTIYPCVLRLIAVPKPPLAPFSPYGVLHQPTLLTYFPPKLTLGLYCLPIYAKPLPEPRVST